MSRLSSLIVLSLAVSATLTPKVSRCQAPVNNVPQMSGSAEAPKTFSAGATVRYFLTQTDNDTFWNENEQKTYTDVDISCDISYVAVTSMRSWNVTLRGETSGTYTWDVTGTAVSTSGNYMDTWRLKNRRLPTDKQYDTYLDVVQQVTLNP